MTTALDDFTLDELSDFADIADEHLCGAFREGDPHPTDTLNLEWHRRREMRNAILDVAEFIAERDGN